MSQIYNDNTKAKAKRKSARDLKNYAFCWKIQQRASGSGEMVVGITLVTKHATRQQPTKTTHN